MYGYHTNLIDEQRWRFLVSIWDERRKHDGQSIEELWFSGGRSDVGRGVAARVLSDGAFLWTMRRAEKAARPDRLDTETPCMSRGGVLEELAQGARWDSGGIEDPSEHRRADQSGSWLQADESAGGVRDIGTRRWSPSGEVGIGVACCRAAVL